MMSAVQKHVDQFYSSEVNIHFVYNIVAVRHTVGTVNSLILSNGTGPSLCRQWNSVLGSSEPFGVKPCRPFSYVKTANVYARPGDLPLETDPLVFTP